MMAVPSWRHEDLRRGSIDPDHGISDGQPPLERTEPVELGISDVIRILLAHLGPNVRRAEMT